MAAMGKEIREAALAEGIRHGHAAAVDGDDFHAPFPPKPHFADAEGEKGPESTVDRITECGIALARLLRPEIQDHRFKGEPEQQPHSQHGHLWRRDALSDFDLELVVRLVTVDAIADSAILASRVGSHQLANWVERMR